MTAVLEPVATAPDELADAPLTKAQKASLERWARAPWKWFMSDAAYFRRLDQFVRDNQRAYYRTLFRVTTYAGPDFRVQMQPGGTWVRATELQHRQAVALGLPTRIGAGE